MSILLVEEDVIGTVHVGCTAAAAVVIQTAEPKLESNASVERRWGAQDDAGEEGGSEIDICRRTAPP